MLISHQIDLHTIGGVEKLFVDFLKWRENAQFFSYQVTVVNKPIHPHLQENIAKHAFAIDTLKYWKELKLPSFLRKWRKQSIVKKYQAQIMLYWNCYEQHLSLMQQQKKTSKIIFYDHGASWNSNKEAKKANFLKQIDCAIAIGHASKRMLQLNCNVTCPIYVITNPLRPSCTIPYVKPKTLNPRRRLNLGMAGRMVPLKGHCIALHALAILKAKGIDAQLQIAGEGQEMLSLQLLTKKLGIQEQVIFHGCLEDMNPFYESIDFYLHPAIREPFGLTTLEALAHGCVPIVSLIDGLPEFVQHQKTGICIQPSLPLTELVKLGSNTTGIPAFVYNPIHDRLSDPKLVDPQQIAEQILYFLQYPETYAQMSTLAIANTQANFSFSAYCQQLYQLFSHITK